MIQIEMLAAHALQTKCCAVAALVKFQTLQKFGKPQPAFVPTTE
jgi:hypothetical protein